MSGLFAVFWHEFRRIFQVRPAFSVFVLAAAIYAILYPQPYLAETLRDVPIAVVDQDGTASSRELARRVDATPDTAVTMVLPDLADAEREVYARHIYGILVIPRDFERDLLHGRASPIALYADASYFLMNQRVSGAVSAVAKTFGTEVETARLIGIGVDPAVATVVTDPLQLTAVPLFNPQGGYATYVLPGAFVLLLQQMLLIGTGLLNTIPGGKLVMKSSQHGAPNAVETVLGKWLAYLAIEALVLPIYLVVLPYLYGIPRLGSVGTILLMAVPFVLAVSGLGMVIAAVFKKPLTVQLTTAAIGMPFFMLAGFAWPAEAIPPAIHLVSLLVPSTSAIDGFVRVSQLGAPLSEIHIQFLTLWGLAAFYGCLAMALETRKRRADATKLGRTGLVASH